MLRGFIAGTAIVTLTIAPAFAALTPGQRCAAAKNSEVGKKIACKTKCDAKSAAKGTGEDSVCLGKCEQHFSSKWDAIEGKGGCVTTIDKDTFESKVDTLRSDLDTTLVLVGAPSKCTSTVFKEAGKDAFCRLKCDIKAQKKNLAFGGPETVPCLGKCSEKFIEKCNKATQVGDCHNPSFDCGDIDTRIDDFVDDAATTLLCVDLTGDWSVSWTGPVSGTCDTFSITQSGAAVSATGSCIANGVATTGALECMHLSFSSEAHCTTGFTSDITVGGGGNSWTGTYDCGGFGSGTVSGTRP